MDRGRRRVDVREQVGGGGLARFADMHHIAGPRRVPFVAVACLDIVGRFDALGRWRQFTVRLETHAALGALPSGAARPGGPLVVALPCPAQGLHARELAHPLGASGVSKASSKGNPSSPTVCA